MADDEIGHPIYLDRGASIPQVKLNIISTDQHSSLDSNEFATLQLTGSDIAMAKKFDPMLLSDLQSAGGYLYISAPRKAFVKLSTDAIAELGVLIDGISYIWLENADSDDQLGLIGDGWRLGSISKSEIALYQDMFGQPDVSYDIYINDNVNGRGPVAIVVAVDATVKLSDIEITDGSLAISQVFFDYMGLNQDQIDSMGASFGSSESIDGSSSNDTIDKSRNDAESPIFVDGLAGDDVLDGGDGGDTIYGGAGNDKIGGNGGKDFLSGGLGNDIIDGGADGARGDIWETGDELQYLGSSGDFTVVKSVDNSSGDVTGVSNQVYFTITDNNDSGGNEGEDIVFNVELIDFQGDYQMVSLVPDIDIWLDRDDNPQGSRQLGTRYSEVLTGTTGFDMIIGKGGNDVLLGEGSGDSSGAGDELEGGPGNDFIDGVLSGTSSSNPWENDNRAFFNGPQSRYTIEPVSQADLVTLVNNSSDTIEFDPSVNQTFVEAYSGSAKFYKVTDGISEVLGGTGTDIVVNVQELSFNDGPARLGIFIETEMDGRTALSKFFEGTDYADTVSLGTESANVNGKGKNGNDIIITGSGSDNLSGGKGNDFIDAKSNTNSNPNESWRIVDEVTYRGDYKNFTLTALTKSEAQALIDAGTLALNSAVDITSSNYNSSTFFRVTDSNVKTSGLGDDLLVNVERVVFDDGYKNLAVSANIHHENHGGSADVYFVNFDGTFGEDVVNARTLKTAYLTSDLDMNGDGRATAVPDATSGANVIKNDFRGGVGDDVYLGGLFGDTVRGGVGNDILDGGTAASLPHGFPEWMDWVQFDEAHYDGNASRYTVTPYQVGSEHVIADVLSVNTFTIAANGEVFQHGSDGNKISSVVDTLASNSTFFIVSDSLPASFGGSGTDLLANISRINFLDDQVALGVTSRTQYGPDGAETGIDGTAYGELIDQSSSSGRNFINPGAGNDVILGGSAKDYVDGSIGNDFINAGGNVTPPAGDFNTWKYNDEVRYSGPVDRYTLAEVWVNVDGNNKPVMTDNAYTVVTTKPGTVVTSGAGYYSAVRITDALTAAAGGEGADILLGVEEVGFEDDHISLATRQEVFDNSGFLEGTFKSETITWTGGGTPAFIDIRAGAGNDIIIGSNEVERINPEAGNDTVDGGNDKISTYNALSDSDKNSTYKGDFVDKAVFKGEASRFTLEKEFVKFDGTTNAALFNVDGTLDTANSAGSGYVEALVVTDSLPDAKGGLGINVLRNVEVINFESGENYVDVWTIIQDRIQSISSSDGRAARNEVAGEVVDGKINKYNYTGTVFSDAINVDTLASKTTAYATVEGSQGNDIIVGASGNFTKLRYDANKDLFTITPNYFGSTLTNITVTHNAPAGTVGYGTDTISNIERIDFIDQQVYLKPRINFEDSNTQEFSGTLLKDVITNSGSKTVRVTASDGNDSITGSNAGMQGSGAWADDTVRYDQLYYLNQLAITQSGSYVYVTKPGSAGIDTLSNVEWIVTKGTSNDVQSPLAVYRAGTELRGSIINDTVSSSDAGTYIDSQNVTSISLNSGNDSFTYTGSENIQVTGGTGNDTITFGSGMGTAIFEGSYERYDISFWDGSSTNGDGIKTLDKIYSSGDKVVVTDKLSLVSGGTGQDVVTGADSIAFSYGKQMLALVIGDPGGGDTPVFNMYSGADYALGTGAVFDMSSLTMGFIDTMNIHVNTSLDSRGFSQTNNTLVGLGRQGIPTSPTYVSGIKLDLTVANDINTLDDFMGNSFLGINGRFTMPRFDTSGGKGYNDEPHNGYKVFGTTGSDEITGTPKVDWFFGDQGADIYKGGGTATASYTVTAAGTKDFSGSNALNPWDAYDKVNYAAGSSRYELSQVVDDGSGSVTGTAGKSYIVVQDKISRDGLGNGEAAGTKVFGTGRDILIDIGQIGFNDTMVWTVQRMDNYQYNPVDRDINGDGSVDLLYIDGTAGDYAVKVFEYTGSQFNDTIEPAAISVDSGVIGRNQFIASSGNDVIKGAARWDNLSTANKILIGGNYNNYADTVRYSAAQEYFKISVSNDVITVEDTRTGPGSYGTDTLTGIDLIEFESGDNFSQYKLSETYGSFYFRNEGQNISTLLIEDPAIDNDYSSIDVGSFTRIEFRDSGGSDTFKGITAAPSTTWMGDVVFYNGGAESFNVTIEPDDSSGNRIVKVSDLRSGTAVTDTLINIEQVRFYNPTSSGSEVGLDLVPNFQNWKGDNSDGFEDFEGTAFSDLIVADTGRNHIRGKAGNDNLIGNTGGDEFNPGAGHDFINGGAAGSNTGGDPWEYRNNTFFDVSSDRVQISSVFVELENIGSVSNVINAATRNADGTFKTYNSGNKPSGAVSVVYIVDDLNADSGKSVGSNILYNIDSVGFSDGVWFEFSGFTDERDFDGDGVIDEVFKEGTPFADTLEGSAGNDFMDGRENNDHLKGGAGGDRLTGGPGNDIIDGGADGTSGDPWRDMDVAEYSGIESRYSISVRNTDVDANSDNVWDNTQIAKSGDYVSKAPVYYQVTDSLGESLGGTGVDVLTNIESINFNDGQVELGMRVQAFDFDGDGTIDFSEISGTSAADSITASDFTLSGDDEIRGKGGNDTIQGGAGGDRINGGPGDDKIDGGDNGVANEFGWTPKDEAIYQAESSRFTISDALTDSNGSVTGVSGQVYYTVADSLPEAMGGNGTDTLWNVEFLSFIDDFMPLGVETFVNKDDDGVELGRYINGTRSGETINGGAKDDDIKGNGGNDTIFGGQGADYIEGGKGDDTIYGGDNGVDENGNIRGDTASYKNSYAQYEITDSLATVDGISITAIKVSDTDASGDGEDTLYGIENLQFDDMYVRVGVESFTNFDQDGVAVSADYRGSILSDTITGTSTADYIEGEAGGDTLNGGGGADYIVGGLGNDTIDGGANGMDPWGNAGEDVVSFSGPSTRYTISHFDAAGTAKSSYQKTGYFTVKDTLTNAKGGEGTDTVRKVERIDFSDKSISFSVNNSFVDVDGDGFPDSGSFLGTTGADTITGTNLDEIFKGDTGDDYIIGGAGGDFLNGGAGNDVLIGGENGKVDSMGRSREDVAEIAMSMASITGGTFIDAFVAKNSTGIYESEGSGGWSAYNGIFAIEVYQSNSGITSGYSAEAAKILVNGSEKDLLVGIEGVEFSDGFVSLQIETRDVDTDGDGIPDKVIKGGTFAGDTITISGSTNDDVDAGPGADTINAGAGDDFVIAGTGNDIIIGGAGNDVVEISATSKTPVNVWVAVNGSGTYQAEANSVGFSNYDGVFSFEVFENQSDTPDSGYTLTAAKVIPTSGSEKDLLIGVEGIQFTDGFTQLANKEKSVDTDGDGTIDTLIKTSTSAADTLSVASGKENTAHVFDSGAGADTVTGSNAGDILIGGGGSDFLSGGANSVVSVNGSPSVDVAVYDGTMTAPNTSTPADYTVASVYVLQNSDGTFVVDVGNGIVANADYYASSAAASTAGGSLSGTQTVVNAFTVTKGSDVDLVTGVEILEFTDGIVQTSPTTSTEVQVSIANGAVEISNINGSSYNDTITSTSSADVMIGNAGVDQYSFATGGGKDTILDFSTAGVDADGDGTVDSYEKIILTKVDSNTGINGTSITSATSALARVTSSGDGSIIDLGTDSNGISHSITLIGVTSTDLTANHFTIV